jgi:predicted lipase
VFSPKNDLTLSIKNTLPNWLEATDSDTHTSTPDQNAPEFPGPLEPTSPLIVNGKENYYYAAATYCLDHRSMKGWKCGHYCRSTPSGTVLLEKFSSPVLGTKGYIAVNYELQRIIIAFQGSYNLRDWILTNARTIPYPFAFDKNIPNGSLPLEGNPKVHEGFLKAYRAVSHRIYDTLEHLSSQHSNFSLYLTGHSLGGALALMAAIHISQHQLLNPSTPIRVYTYGQPRVGNADFVNHLAKQRLLVYRYVNDADEVADLPPTVGGYVHYGMEIWFHNGRVFPCFPQNNSFPTTESKYCSNSVLIRSLIDHNNYFNEPIQTLNCLF